MLAVTRHVPTSHLPAHAAIRGALRNQSVSQALARTRSHRRPARCPRVGRVEEVEIGGQAVEGEQARFAIAGDRLGAAVRNPRAAGARHAARGHDARAARARARAEGAGEEPLVVAELVLAAAVGAGGVEDGDTGFGRRGDRRGGAVLVAALVGREAHATNADAKLGGVRPWRTRQAREGTNPAPNVDVALRATGLLGLRRCCL